MPAVSLHRVALAALSLLIAAWFGLGIVQAHDESEATKIVSRLEQLSPADAAHVDDLLDGAGTLNPDSHVDVLRAELALHRRQLPAARALLDDVVAREPKAIEAWALLADALKRTDPAAARRARAEVLRLAPSVPGP